MSLSTEQLKNLGSWDKAGRWYPIEEIKTYFQHIRSPSHHWRATQTEKFATWLRKNHSNLIKE